MKRHVLEVIVVEGCYDKNAVSRVVDAAIIETSGFGILNNTEKVTLLQKLAEKCGLILLMDSDRAGFFIRGRLKGMLGDSNIKHAYIPDIEGRERRKKAPSKEGKLGVEGMTGDAIIKSLEQAGATFTEANNDKPAGERITKSDLFSLGLSGGEESAKKRQDILKRLELPARLSANGMLDVINLLFTKEEFYRFLDK